MDYLTIKDVREVLTNLKMLDDLIEYEIILDEYGTVFVLNANSELYCIIEADTFVDLI